MRSLSTSSRGCICAVVVASAAAALPGTATAGSLAFKHCRSADLRYPFEEGGPNTFGVFKLKISNGRCRTAHRVAKEWMQRFEDDLADGRLKLPKHVDGFTFKTLPATEAQTFRERGRDGDRTIRFDYRVPNG
jgi:hypothetical protein